jgi:DNA replication and repair protein RecF
LGYFKNINLLNFRNFDFFQLDFSNNCNVLYGLNGAGKTNILEGISLFAKGRGLRKDKISNIIKNNYEKFKINSEFQHKKIIYNLISESEIQNSRVKKKFLVNNDKTKEVLNSFYDLVPFLYFLPETERLFLSSPSNRRNFIDQLIFTYKNNYNLLMNKYNKFIQERSKILNSNYSDSSWLAQLEQNISKIGLQIYLFRERQINLLMDNLSIYINNFKLPYKISIRLNDQFFKKNIDQEFYEKTLRDNRKIDTLLGGSKIGPHKSDYIFYVNDNFQASQLSTGQQKTIILLVFLSHCNYLVNHQSKEPILILDEVCSHLDLTNRKILLTLIQSFDLQIFMTGTTKDLFSFLSTNTNFCNITNI